MVWGIPVIALSYYRYSMLKSLVIAVIATGIASAVAVIAVVSRRACDGGCGEQARVHAAWVPLDRLLVPFRPARRLLLAQESPACQDESGRERGFEFE